MLSLVRSWSRALDAHDVAALASMYAPRVQFHGREVARDAVLAAKRRALGRGSVFHQSIVGNITVSPSDAGGHTVACTAVLSDAGP